MIDEQCYEGYLQLIIYGIWTSEIRTWGLGKWTKNFQPHTQSTTCCNLCLSPLPQ